MVTLGTRNTVDRFEIIEHHLQELIPITESTLTHLDSQVKQFGEENIQLAGQLRAEDKLENNKKASLVFEEKISKLRVENEELSLQLQEVLASRDKLEVLFYLFIHI